MSTSPDLLPGTGLVHVVRRTRPADWVGSPDARDPPVAHGRMAGVGGLCLPSVHASRGGGGTPSLALGGVVLHAPAEGTGVVIVDPRGFRAARSGSSASRPGHVITLLVALLVSPPHWEEGAGGLGGSVRSRPALLARLTRVEFTGLRMVALPWFAGAFGWGLSAYFSLARWRFVGHRVREPFATACPDSAPGSD